MNLLKNHPYRHLFYSGIVNGIGDRFSQVAVLTLVLHLTGSGLAVGAALGVRFFPFLVLSPLGGRLADHLNKKYLLMATDLLRIPFALSFLLVDSEEDLWIVFIGIVALSCGEAFYLPVRKTTIASLADDSILIKVNGMEQLILGIVLIGGSITGGAVAYVFGNDIAFLLNAGSFLAAAILVRKLPTSSQSQNHIKGEPGSLDRVYKGLSFLVFVAVALQFITATMDGVFNVLISVYGAATFNMDELGVGLLYGSLGTGLVFSFLLAGRLKKNFLFIGMITIFIESTLQMAASQAANLVLLSIIFIGISFIGGIGGASIDTFIMQKVPEGRHGRVFGLVEAVTNIQMGVIMFATGLALESFPERNVGLIGGLTGLIGGSVLWIAYGLILFMKKK
ncbi:MFS transporter [Halobacillus sp. BBL2006]|uniref:MFS transporter n=1 Tax=Halobacillus sp. BBL2006 TaxID=1543706 RepID=UPI0005438164|nr:MFS transporter [Halobacillus sp. BBL2006]KHE67151.1 hypothetical protein LD39_19020 [Halobacillus sp. BBL2006]